MILMNAKVLTMSSTATTKSPRTINSKADRPPLPAKKPKRKGTALPPQPEKANGHAANGAKSPQVPTLDMAGNAATTKALTHVKAAKQDILQSEKNRRSSLELDKSALELDKSAGERLIQAKELVPHGTWANCLTENGISIRQAQLDAAREPLAGDPGANT